MSQNGSSSGLPGFLQRISGWITAVIGFLTGLIGFIKLVQGDVGLVTKVLLTFGIVVLWLTCAYFYWKPAPKVRTAGFTPPTSSKQRKRVRRLALAGMFAIPIVTATGFYGWQQYQSRPSDQIVVLVAEFKSLQPEENYAVTESIIKQLRLATRKYSDVKIQPLKKPIPEQEGSEVARKEGKKIKASIVIWGWYGTKGDKVPVSANFEVLKPPKHLPQLGQTASGMVQTPAIAELKSFTLQTRLSKEMAYLSLFTLGMTRYTASEWDEAIARFSAALSQIAERTTVLDRSIVYFYRGCAYIAKGNYDSAIADYNQAIKLNPHFELYFNRGSAYGIKGNYDRAIADFNQSLKLQPEALTYNNRGFAYLYKGEYDRAVADFNKALELQPDLEIAYLNRGKFYLDKQEFDLAITDFNAALKLQPNLVLAYVNRSAAYLSKGEFDRAITDVNQVLKLKNKSVVESGSNITVFMSPQFFVGTFEPMAYEAVAYNNRSAAYLKKRDYDRAIADANQAIKLQPNYFQPYLNRGFIYEKKGDYDRALADYNQVLKLHPKYANAYNARGWYYAQRGEYDRAIADANQALKLQPNAPHIIDTRGFAYAGKGDYDRALADYNQALKLDPNYGESYLHRGIVYRKQGKRNQAIADFKKALELTKDSEIRQDAKRQLQELGVK
jgi:tetratricopeptide (TPR) repeat protein